MSSKTSRRHENDNKSSSSSSSSSSTHERDKQQTIVLDDTDNSNRNNQNNQSKFKNKNTSIVVVDDNDSHDDSDVSNQNNNRNDTSHSIDSDSDSIEHKDSKKKSVNKNENDTDYRNNNTNSTVAEEYLGFDDSTTSPSSSYQPPQHQHHQQQSKKLNLGSRLSEESTATLAPWVKRSYAKNPLYSLEQEIYDFVEYIKPTPLEHKMREEIVQRIREVVVGAWKHAKVEVFGSFANGLYLPMSDIDIVIFGGWDQLPLFTLAKLLEESKIAKNVKVIDKTSVPIIKMADALSGVFVDISFKLESGLKAVEFIRACVAEYRMLYYITFVVKQFLAQRQLNEPYSGGLGSYSVVLLVVSFLQRHPRQDKDPNLGVLLCEFFELYGKDFNYRKVGISVTDGGRYFPKENLTQNANEIRPFIQDPLDPNNDVGYKSFNMIVVRDAFRHAFDTLTRVTSDPHSQQKNSLLSEILRVEDDVIAFREWVAKGEWQLGTARSESNSTTATATTTATSTTSTTSTTSNASEK